MLVAVCLTVGLMRAAASARFHFQRLYQLQELKMKRDQLREKIKQAKDRKIEKIPAGTYEGWDFDIYLRMVSGNDANEIGKVYSDSKAKDGEGAANIALTDLLLTRSLCDEDGLRLFEDNEVDLIKERGHSAVQDITRRALKLSRLDKTAQDDAVKPSGDAPTP
jgi:hypothetical protein